jgi:hypothetical protein
MATPHVAGVMALELVVAKHNPATLKKLLVGHGIKNVINVGGSLPAGTANVLLTNTDLL